jgi:hypothetical protein
MTNFGKLMLMLCVNCFGALTSMVNKNKLAQTSATKLHSTIFRGLTILFSLMGNLGTVGLGENESSRD